MELTDEQRAMIEANKERAKRRRLERYIGEIEAFEEKPVEERQAVAESLGGGFIPPSDDEEFVQATLVEQSEILFPLELNETCCVCRSVELDDFIQKNYRVKVCCKCRESHPDRFSLLTKTAAREEFLLTDEELADSARVPHISKPNPLKPTWSNMQLFLREQVIAFALEKWGSLEGIEAEAQRRADAQQSLKEKKYTKNLKELRRKTKLVKKVDPSKLKTHHHRHVFEEHKDLASGMTESRCTECGFKVISEEL